MYDFMIKEILNPENTPERVNELLTLLLGQRVRIVDVLPNDGTRLADESTLLITDMVVQLEDGSIANLEIQKIGYYFPGERSACYSADLLLRQYKRVRGIKGKRFSYRDINRCTRSCYSKKVQPNSRNFPIIISIGLCKNLIQG